MYVSSKEAQKSYKVSPQTLRTWADNGQIETQKTNGGHNRYLIQHTNIKKTKNKYTNIIYARVSSQKQKSDLERQVQFLQQKFPDYYVITDIGSGINFKRKGFNTILDQLYKRNVRNVVVYSRDRLARFGIELIENIFKSHGAKLYIETDQCESDEQELAEDLISIITVFTKKQRKGSKKIQNETIQESQKLS